MSRVMMNRVRTVPSFLPASAAALVCGAFAPGVHAQSITNIGVPAGATTSGANAVSANGSAVAASVFFESANRWSAGVFTNLGLTPGAFAAGTEDISHDGNAIVGSVFFITPEETARAYRWTAGGGMQELGTLPGGIASIGNGISGDGNVVTGASFDQDFNTTAFRWTSAGGMQSLGTLTGGTSSEGRRVSQNGSVIVGVSNTPNGERAFRWTESDGMQSLGLWAPTDSGSSAFGISADGSVVAGFSGSNAVIWTNSIAQNLGALPGADGAVAYTLTGDASQNALPEAGFTHWHDRAVMHFLTDEQDVRAYAAQATRAVAPGGHAVIGGFAPDGPERCSGLPVARRSAEDIAAALGPAFQLVTAAAEAHVTPGR